MLSKRIMVILRIKDSRSDEAILRSGVNTIAIPANAKNWKELIEPFSKGFSFAVYKTPGSTDAQVEEMSSNLATLAVIVDYSYVMRLDGDPGPIGNLDPKKYEIYILTSEDTYSDFLDAGDFQFDHKFAMIYPVGKSIRTQSEIARTYPYSVPVFIALSAEEKQGFHKNMQHLEFTGELLFWSPTVLDGVVFSAVTKSSEPRLVVKALRPAIVRSSPSTNSKTAGKPVKVGDEYPYHGRVAGAALDFAKITFERRELFVMMSQSGIRYFTEPYEPQEKGDTNVI